MRYLIEQDGDEDENWIFINVNRKICDQAEKYLPGDEWKSPLVTDLFAITGIYIVQLNRYGVWIRRGSAFEWGDIPARAVQVLKKHIDPNGPLIDVAKERAEKKADKDRPTDKT